jgi:hypothetical protein
MNDFEYPKGPDVYWERWIDPYKLAVDELEWNEFDEENADTKTVEFNDLPSTQYEKEFEQDGDQGSGNGFLQIPGIKHLFTPFGIVPLTEHSHPAKLFKFWTGHTNFSITKDLAYLMSTIKGVETLNIWTRYRFRIGIGKLFDDKVVMLDLKETMIKYYKGKHAKTDTKSTINITRKPT